MSKQQKNIIAIIFARGGSKGLKNKNLKHFCGKPLIAWAIEQAYSVKYVNRVIVSTDSKRIAKIAKNYNAEVPFLRPKNLATDKSPELYSWQHALKFLKKSEGSLPEVMVSIPTTSPLREVVDIEKSIRLYLKSKVDAVITITKSKKNPNFNMVKLSSNGLVSLYERDNLKVYNRQDVTSIFDVTTVSYVVRPKFILKTKHLFSGKIKAIEIPYERSVDIDNLIDFQIAEFLMLNKKSK